MSLNDHYHKDSNAIHNEDGFDMQTISDSEDEETIMYSDNKYCQSCVKCAYKLLYQFNMEPTV